MTIKSAKDLNSSLRGANFRKAVLDGRCWQMRSIKTLRTLYYTCRLPRTDRERSGSDQQRAVEARQLRSEPQIALVRRFE